MSLLIDALKQAEAARAQAQSTTTPPAAEGIALEPLAERNGAVAVEPVTPPQALTRPPARDARRIPIATQAISNVANDAARELFEVKQPAANRLPIIFAAVTALLFVTGAGYVWWAIQPRSNLTGPGLSANAAAPTAVTPAGDLAERAHVQEPLDHVLTSAMPSVQADSKTAPAMAAASARNSDSKRELRSSIGSTARRAPNRTSVEAAPQRGVEVDQPLDAHNSNGIQAAYAAFLAGNYVLARQRYQEVLRLDSRSVDAMNALGLIAWRSGQPDVAERMFRAAVHADPKDATAMSQLALLYAEGDPTAAESRLRNLIASQPSAGASYSALGSLLARQERWSEAQQALFQAYTLDSDNPDVLFNLAVCLEHLSQPSVARQFYERALQAAARRPAGFDKSVAQSRTQALGNR